MELKVVLDVSGIEAMWQILDRLRSYNHRDDTIWNELFASPGYASLTKSEFTQALFRDVISKVSNPHKAEERFSTTDSTRSSFIEHFRQGLENRTKITSFLNDFRRKTSQLGPMIADLVEDYLPERALLDEVKVAFVLFQMDARGYEWIVVDALLAMKLGDLLHRLIAHEYHHQCRDALLCYDKEVVQNEDKDVMWSLNQIQAEGIADQIDKPDWFFGHNPVDAYSGFVEQYHIELKKAEGTLDRIDSVIQKEHQKGTSQEIIGKKVREILPLSGHPIGYFMAKAIFNAGLGGEMIDSVGNPFEFFRLYNKSRNILGESPFSESTMDFLVQLEEKYS